MTTHRTARRTAYQLITPIGTFNKGSLAAAIFAAQNLGYKSTILQADGTTVASYHPNIGVSIYVR